jgi:bifunctional non-homologous end joining protein LigD
MPALDEYRAKRDFTRTAEPAGEHTRPVPDVEGRHPARRFVVQRHRARRLHYDLRLEIDGVLASWAVPKGVTLDPAARHLAVHVEDHPIEYLDFEGVIPAGEYGGGDVIVWDIGAWVPHRADDPAAAVRDGELHFDLVGEKLHGRFVLVRRGERGEREQWLLLHKRDEFAVDGWDVEAHPASVLSGRTNDEVANDPHAIWHSDRAVTTSPVPFDRSDPALAQLDALGNAGEWEFDGVVLRLTNLDKALFPGRDGEPALTKRDLIRYYARVAPVLLPHLEGRALNLRRYPNGVDRPGFWHKKVPSHAPEWLARWRDEGADAGETQWYTVADRPATLAWLANYGAIEIHPWTSRTDAPAVPTYALIDIDPGDRTTWDDVLVLARLFRTALDHLRIEGFAKVSGSAGIHIYVPVDPDSGDHDVTSFDATRAWIEQLSRTVGGVVPELVSWEWAKQRRGGLARLDFTQNAINKTLVAPYGVRARPGAPISMPIRWGDLDDPQLRPDRWSIRDGIDHVIAAGDDFAGALRARQPLPAVR